MRSSPALPTTNSHLLFDMTLLQDGRHVVSGPGATTTTSAAWDPTPSSLCTFLSVTLSVLTVLTHTLAILTAVRHRRRGFSGVAAGSKLVLDEMIAALSVCHILAVLVPGPVAVAAYVSQHWHRVTCQFYQVGVMGYFHTLFHI